MYLGLVILAPLAGFLTLLIFGSALSRRLICVIGVMSIAISFAFSLACALEYTEASTLIAWTWIPSDSGFFEPLQIGFYLDHLSLMMICMVTFVATWIAMFSVQFMEEEEGISRFFASMNLFVASMLILVLADNLLLLLLGWEGVGLCSYLLIGFWYQNADAHRAATKAFITTRIGDVGLLIAILIIAATLGSLVIQDLAGLAMSEWGMNSATATIVALCLLFAATGKSAQLPLQTWLPDAMLGPTPVSALIHAATMVTAGVYLIARLSGLFALSSTAQTGVLIVGAVTLLVGGFSALAQSDLKRVLAYSTMSQIGYMFLALGAGAYSAAMFHLLTHAFFKALLFLSAGVIGYAAHHEYNMFNLGGLKKTLPLAYYSFLVGALCLCALPLVTSGFYSKEFILSGVLFSVNGGVFAWACGIVGAFVTGLYTFRAITLTFFGEPRTAIEHQPGILMALPLLVLGVFSVGIGFIQMPESVFDVKIFENWLDGLFPNMLVRHVAFLSENLALVVASVVSVAGIIFGVLIFRTAKPKDNLLTHGFRFDEINKMLLITPFSFVSHFFRRDIFGRIATMMAELFMVLANFLGRAQSGRLSDYASFAAFSISFILVVGFLVLR